MLIHTVSHVVLEGSVKGLSSRLELENFYKCSNSGSRLCSVETGIIDYQEHYPSAISKSLQLVMITGARQAASD